MQILIAPTEDFVKGYRSTLTGNVAAGSNVTLSLANNHGASQYDFLVIGRGGGELVEMAQINQAVVPGTDVVVASLVLPHKKDDLVTCYRFNKRKFYGALSIDGPYVELTNSPVNISVDDNQAATLEYDGTGGYQYFKATYYNSYNGDETDIEDSVPVEVDDGSRYCSLFAIRVQAGLTENTFITDDRLEAKRAQAESEINSALFSIYTLPLSYVPPLIQRICVLLAAGYIDYEEFKGDGMGVKWLGEARGLLNSIKNGTQRLLDANSAELSRIQGTNVLDGFPIDSEGQAFTKTMRF